MKHAIILALMSFGFSIAGFSQNVGIGTTTPINKLEVVTIAATANNAAVHVTNKGNSGNAVLAASNNANTYGIRGTSNQGTGIQGYTSTGYALAGVSLSGTAVYAQSGSGYSLISSGKIQIRGGNTNPSAGALLTSDANGNARWKRSNISFSVNTAASSSSPSSATKVEFSNEAFDTQNNFTIYAGAVTAGSSVFTAPVAGVYHFTAAILLEKTNVSQYSRDFNNAGIRLKVNGSLMATAVSGSITHQNSGGGFSCFSYVNIDADVHLSANDLVWLEVIHEPDGPLDPVPLNRAAYNCRFDGSLLFAD